MPGQQFITIYKETDQPFEDVVFDGILGIGMPELAVNVDGSLIENMVKNGYLERHVFSLFLSNMDDTTPS